MIAEYTNGSLSKEYVYSGSKLLATVTGTAVTYHHPDHLSNRLETDSSGATTRTFGHLPFGESWYETGSGHLDPQDVLDTQIWELGNSLERITGQPGGNSPDESGAQNLQDCYHNGGPKKQ